jgi:hypothetical protein
MAEGLLTAVKAVQTVLGWGASINTIAVPSSGTSNAFVAILSDVKSKQRCVVKCVRDGRISLIEEVARKNILVPYLAEHLPEVIWCGIIDEFEVLLVECRGVQTLHDMIVVSVLSQSSGRAIWKDVTSSLLNMWQNSRHRYEARLCPRFYPKRADRIRTGVSTFLRDQFSSEGIEQYPVIINDKCFQNLNTTLARLDAIIEPTYGVTCHGDPQPSNIIITEERDWLFVDWEWSGRNHDWRMMLSHLYAWWPIHFSLLSEDPALRVADQRLHISYKASVPTHIQSLQGDAIPMFGACSSRETTESDLAAANLYIAALLLGELRFIHQSERMLFAAQLIGEATRIVECIHSGGDIRSLIPFGFSPDLN